MGRDLGDGPRRHRVENRTTDLLQAKRVQIPLWCDTEPVAERVFEGPPADSRRPADVPDAGWLIGVVLDTSGHDRFFNLEADRRLSNHLTLDIEARFFWNTEPGDLFNAFKRDDYVQLHMSYFF